MAGYLIQQSTDTKPLLFLLVASNDHISPKTGATPVVTLSKNGGEFAAPIGDVVEVGQGWYAVEATAEDANTIGPLVLHATDTDADPTDVQFQVVGINPDEAGAGVWEHVMGTDASNTAGGYLSNIKSQVGLLPTSLIGSSYTGPGTADNTSFSMIRGDDYTTAIGAIVFTSETWPDLTGATLTITARKQSDDSVVFTKSGTVVTAGTGVQEITFEPTHTDTNSLVLGTHNYDVQATLAGGLIKTLIIGQVTIYADYTR